MKTDGIILDIDGTLWNSTPIVAEAWNEIIEKRDDIPFRFTAKQLTQLFGRPLPVIADMVFPFLEEKERYDLINECCEREHELLHAEHPLSGRGRDYESPVSKSSAFYRQQLSVRLY